MKTPWREEQLSRLPKQFEPLNSNQFVQRRNIRVSKTTNEMTEESETTYICESRVISSDLYEEYMDLLSTPAQEETKQALNDISAGQTIGGDNQLSIMEAMADLYDLIAQLL